MQHLEPIFFLQCSDYMERIVFVSELSNFVPDRALGDVLDIVVFFGRVKALLGAFFKGPVKACSKAGGANEARWIFDEGVVVQYTKKFGLDVSYPVEGVEQ